MAAVRLPASLYGLLQVGRWCAGTVSCRKWTVALHDAAGSQNPLPLGLGTVRKFLPKEE